MLARWRAAGLIWPTIMTALMLPFLISLGTWQLHRKAWKEDLIAKIEARRTAEPVTLKEALDRNQKQAGEIEYLRVTTTGTFDYTKERHLYAPTEASQGWHVFTHFKPEGGLPGLFINRGWVPDKLKDPATRAQGQVDGPVTVTGLARVDQMASTFSPENDRKGNRWYVRDTWEMRWEPNADLPGKRPLPLQFSIDAEAEPANPGGWPKGGTTEIHLFNSHLQYVVTWYGLALTLIGVFVVFARQRLKALDDGALQP